MGTTPAKQTRPGTDDVDRGPNEEAVSTAQENVNEGYGSAGKAAIISGKPDGDTQGRSRVNHDQARSPSTPARE